jgi:enoyl-[acyl-carrier-protein] reductase (NADH)
MKKWCRIDGLINAAGGNVAAAMINPDQNLFDALIYLLSDASAFVSGEVILVDGGFTAFSGV